MQTTLGVSANGFQVKANECWSQLVETTLGFRAILFLKSLRFSILFVLTSDHCDFWQTTLEFTGRVDFLAGAHRALSFKDAVRKMYVRIKHLERNRTCLLVAKYVRDND